MITLGTLIVTDEDLAIIAHAVHNETPEEWATRAYTYTNGDVRAILGKIARHRDSYIAAKDDPEYKTAAEREESKRRVSQALDDKMRIDAKARKIAEATALDDKIAAEVARQLEAR